jgi:hypothetical protein
MTMSDRMRNPIRGSVIAATVLALAIGAQAVWASIPGAGGAISACYKTISGDLRVIDLSAGGACQKSETGLGWQQVGPQGPPGQQGIQGIQGIQGPPGVQGPTGVGVSDYQVVTTLGTTAKEGDISLGSAFARCPDGTRVVGGGFKLPSSANLSVQKNEATVSNFGDLWEVTVYGDDGWAFTAYAICVNKAQITGS